MEERVELLLRREPLPCPQPCQDILHQAEGAGRVSKPVLESDRRSPPGVKVLSAGGFPHPLPEGHSLGPSLGAAKVLS